MPLYEYRCENGHTFEVTQRMADDPVQVCEVCGVPVQRVFHPVAVHFKGSGFYNTDYGKGKGKAAGADSDGSKSDSGSGSGSDSKASSGSGSGDGGGEGSKKDSGESKAAASSD
jgi:putative FmdB family regulatory protein